MFEACRLIRARAAALVVLGLAVTGPASAQEPPDLSGVWRLSEKAREELGATVEAAVGPEKTQGGGSSRARFTLLSRGSSEVDRIQLRNYLMGQVAGFEDLEIEQTAEEITLARGNDSVRLFSFARERTRQTDLGGLTKARASWKDGQLRLEENGDGLKVVEAFTLIPNGKRLGHVLHLEAKLLKEPLKLSLFYDRVTEAEE